MLSAPVAGSGQSKCSLVQSPNALPVTLRYSGRLPLSLSSPWSLSLARLWAPAATVTLDGDSAPSGGTGRRYCASRALRIRLHVARSTLGGVDDDSRPVVLPGWPNVELRSTSSR